MKVAHILQSGFLAWPCVELTKSPEKDVSFKASLYTPDYQVIDTENYYDKEVERLFQLWRQNDANMRSFQFREAVILTAYRCFRDKTLVPWLRLQFGHASLTYMHRKFLVETFGSIFRNVPRTLDNKQYYMLLEPSPDAPPQTMDDRQITENLLKIFDYGQNNLVSNVIRSWTEDLDGFCDLLSTLHVLFGKRSGTMSVSSK